MPLRRGRRGELPAETSSWQAWTSLRINQPEIILEIFELARTTVLTPVLAMAIDFSATWRRRVVTHPPRTSAEAPAEFPQIACRDRHPRIDPFKTIHRPSSGRPVIQEQSGGSTSPDWRIQIKLDCLPSGHVKAWAWVRMASLVRRAVIARNE